MLAVLRLEVESHCLFGVNIFELRHLDCHPPFGHPFDDLVQEAEHMGKTEVESIVFSREIVLGVGFFVLPDVELRILS